ncbi:PAS domain S-box protein [uncultured Methanospirillum sp.]|uniref:PAS domain S-box protein n=1 Tax=uncultured Methanospirillum sp. TaxID=262503 RepID=UPI0029C72920|nr:PAS domain S-box protein [uncultured Methanospirillum sp.]
MLNIYHIPDKTVIAQFPNVRDYSHPDTPVDMLQTYWELVFSGEDTLFEGRSVCPLDKETFDAEFFLTKIEFENHPAILASVRNISERKQAERALFNVNEELKVRTEEVQNQSRFLQDLMDTLPIPIFYKDIKGTYTGCNTEFERYNGKPRDQIIGRSVYELWPEPMAEIFYQADLQVFQTPHRQQYETTIRYHDGSVHDVIFYKAPIFTISNHVDGLIGTFLDITERKRAEEALKESESFNRGLIENLPDYIAVYGYDKKILYVNPALTTALGYSFEDLVSEPVFSYIGDEFRSKSEEVVSSRIEGRIPPVYEADILCRDHKRRSVIIKGTRIQYRQNPAILLLMSDITLRRQMEQALRENEEKFVSIFEKTPDPVLILDSSYQIIEVNRGFEKYFEYSHAEVHGKNVDDLGIRLHQEAIELLLNTSENNSHASLIEMELLKRTGSPFIAEVTISRIIINTESCFIIQIHDIDEIRKAHEAISQVNHKLKILSSVTRHDILNRIMVTSAYSGMLLEDVQDPDFQRKLNAIRQSSEEIRILIEFTGQYQNLGETTPTWQVLEGLFSFRAIQGLLSGIRLTLDLGGVEIYADNMLEKVIYNLVENSVRHGKNLTRISLSSHEESGTMMIWYEDDGGGIIPEEKEKAFEKGFGKNTGRGLFLIREILSITGITITENGIFGTGVRFEMVVPAGIWRFTSTNRIRSVE